MRVILKHAPWVLLAGSLVVAGLLWLLPINWYEATLGVHACDPEGLAFAGLTLVVGLALLSGAVFLVLVDKSAGRRRKTALLALAVAALAIHLARGPALLRERAWTQSTCDVAAPMDARPLH
jgi:hypothetical protein